MLTEEKLEKLRLAARKDVDLRERIIATERKQDPLKSFCAISTQYGIPLSPMEVISFGEDAYAAMRRSTNGGGENSPLLDGEDDYYELFLAEMKALSPSHLSLSNPV